MKHAHTKKILAFLLLIIICACAYSILTKGSDTSAVSEAAQASFGSVPASATSTPRNNPVNTSSVPGSTSTLGSSTADLLRGMKITFDDEFNSFSRYTDAGGNVTCNPGGKGTWQTVFYFCSRTIPTNDEAEVYTDQNFLDYLNSNSTSGSSTATSPFSVNSGILTITATPTDQIIRSAVGSWAKYTSGLITTQFSFSQTYGYFEIRAKLPAGDGLWPAFWLLPVDKSWPPEIDVFEAFGGPNALGEGGVTSIHYASHSSDASQSCGAWHPVGVDITKGFHTYGVDWEPTGITYYFDGQPYVTCQPNPEADKPFYILVNLAVGGEGSWPSVPNLTNTWPAQMDVDYVRAYQKK